MNRPSDTPPDGDFARYIEALGRHPPPPAAADDRRRIDAVEHSILKPTAPPLAPETRSALPPLPERLKTAFTGISLSKHFRGLLLLWLFTQVLKRFVPEASFLMLPLVVGYVIWLFVRVKQNLDGTLMPRIRPLADRSGPKSPGSR